MDELQRHSPRSPCELSSFVQFITVPRSSGLPRAGNACQTMACQIVASESFASQFTNISEVGIRWVWRNVYRVVSQVNSGMPNIESAEFTRQGHRRGSSESVDIAEW
jgi:hypothetical protein